MRHVAATETLLRRRQKIEEATRLDERGFCGEKDDRRNRENEQGCFQPDTNAARRRDYRQPDFCFAVHRVRQTENRRAHSTGRFFALQLLQRLLRPLQHLHRARHTARNLYVAFSNVRLLLHGRRR